MLKLDIGCGAAKRPGFVGIDVIADQGADLVCDISRERLPFDDASADYVFSSHCLEHIRPDRLVHVLQEMTRVAAEGATIEIWHPLVFHSDAFVFGHVTYLSESIYEHAGCIHRDFWAERAFGGTRWLLEEMRYAVDAVVQRDMKKANIGLDFAVSYFRDVVREIGIFIRVERSGASCPTNYARGVYGNREELIKRLSPGPRGRAALTEAPRR